jgi:hypothetical protein
MVITQIFPQISGSRRNGLGSYFLGVFNTGYPVEPGVKANGYQS